MVTRKDLDMSQILPIADRNADAPETIAKMPVIPTKIVVVTPQSQMRTLLGKFDSLDSLKGFSIEVTPDPDPEDSVTTFITLLERDNRSELYLHITNYGTRTVTAAVRAL